MKLSYFNPETLAEPKKPAEIYLVIRKTGVAFTKPAEKLLNLTVGNKIEFCKDVNNGDMYFFISPKGFPIKKLGQQIGISCNKLSAVLWPSRKDGEKSTRMLLHTTPIHDNNIEYYLLSPVKK